MTNGLAKSGPVRNIGTGTAAGAAARQALAPHLAGAPWSHHPDLVAVPAYSTASSRPSEQALPRAPRKSTWICRWTLGAQQEKPVTIWLAMPSLHRLRAWDMAYARGDQRGVRQT